MYDPSYSSTHGGNLAKNMFNKRMSSYTPKSLKLIEDIIRLGLNNSGGNVLDFFAGSGTTGDAIINLKRNDGIKETFMVEMGQHFSEYLKPRILKSAFSKVWKDGKPQGIADSVTVEQDILNWNHTKIL